MSEDAGNGRFVTWGRYDAEHTDTLRRLAELEQGLRGMAGFDEIHRAMSDRISAQAAEIREMKSAIKGRRDRAWGLITTVLACLILPLIATAVLALIHSASLH